MSFLSALLDTEPAITVGAVTAVLAALVSFGLPLTDVQSKAVGAAVLAVIVFASAVVTRMKAYAPATVARIVKAIPAAPDSAPTAADVPVAADHPATAG